MILCLISGYRWWADEANLLELHILHRLQIDGGEFQNLKYRDNSQLQIKAE